MQAASLHTSIVLESSSFLVPLRDVTSEVEKSSRKMEQEQNRLARSAERLLGSIDPAYAAQSRFNREMAEADRLLKAGAISAEQHAQATRAIKAALDEAMSAASRSVAAEQERLAASADRLLSSVDPLYAAQSRFNKELAEARQLFQQGAISAQQFATVEGTLKARLEQATAALKAHDMASAQSQQRMRLLGYQISDIGAQLVGGQSPFMVLAQQGPQVAMAFDGAKGAVGRFASFLTGPYGAAMLAATAAAGTLWMKMQESKNITEEHERASKTLKQAIEDLDRATGLYNQTLGKKIRLEEEDVREKLQDDIKARNKAREQLAQARKVLESQSIFPTGGDAAAAKARADIERLTGEIERLDKSISDAEASLRRSSAALVLQDIRESLDPATAAIGRYERALESLVERRSKNEISEDEFRREAEALERRKTAELEAARAADRAAKAQEKAARDWQKAADSRIQSLLKERAAMERYAEDMRILQEAMSSGVINAMERDLAGRRARQEWLDGLGLEKIEASIAKFDPNKLIKKSLPTFDAKELQRLEGQRQITEELERSAERARQLDQAATQFAATMTSGFEDAIFAGKGLRSVFSGLLEDMGKMVIRLTVMEPLARSVADTLKGGFGASSKIVQGDDSWFDKVIRGVGGVFGGIFGGFRANGGPVTAGRTYLVGERGPELFTPSSSGAIIPNGALQGMTGGGRNITVHVDARDAVLASTVKQWVQEAITVSTLGGSAMAQQDLARRARRRIPGT